MTLQTHFPSLLSQPLELKAPFKSYHFKWSLFPSALSTWDPNSGSLDSSLLPSHREKEPSDIDATDVELQQVRRWRKFWRMTSPLLSSQCCASAGFVPWEFCNGLAWDTPGIQSSCEGFPCKLQTQIYCREGNLRAPAIEARWNRPFPGNSEETLWRQLAHCPATGWKCKLWAAEWWEEPRYRGDRKSSDPQKLCVMVTSRAKMKKRKSLLTSSIYILQ